MIQQKRQQEVNSWTMVYNFFKNLLIFFEFQERRACVEQYRLKVDHVSNKIAIYKPFADASRVLNEYHATHGNALREKLRLANEVSVFNVCFN